MRTRVSNQLLFCFLLFVGWVCSAPAAGGTLYVDPVSGRDTWDGSWMMPIAGTEHGPLLTLGAAVARAQSSDLVVLLDGLYEGEQNVGPGVFASLGSKGLFLYSFYGPENCVLALERPVTLGGQGTASGIETVFDGVTIRQTGSGGAVNVANTRVYFNDCILRDFKAGFDYVIGCMQSPADLIFTHCRFLNNQRPYIVSLLNETATLSMDQCEFAYNTCQTAVNARFCDAVVRHCTFQGTTNMADTLICLMLYDNRNAVAENCTFKDNRSSQSFSAVQVYLDGRSTAVPVIGNCSIFGNSAAGPLYAIDLKTSGSARVDGCTIYDNQSTGYECVGVQNNGVNLSISNTTIEWLDSTRSFAGSFGLSCSNYRRLSVENCRISNIDTGIRLLPAQGNDGEPQTVIRNVAFVGNAIHGEQVLPESAAILVNHMPHPFTVSGCDFRDNGSAIYLYGSAGQLPFELNNCLFAGNRGLAMRLESLPQWPITLNNCTVVSNGDFTLIYIIFNNCIIRSNGSLVDCTTAQVKLNYCCYPVPWPGPGTGNLIAQPLFADETAGDYHLKSRYGRFDPASGSWVKDAEHSLCIDAGNPSDGVGLEPYGSGGRINIGRYGGTPEASKSALCAGGADGTGGMLSDFNRDCEVNLSDMAVFAGEWLHSTRVQQQQ